MGKPKGQHGGKRAGAGRKAGSSNALPLGAVQAVEAQVLAQKRLAGQAVDPAAKDLLAESQARLLAVMRGEVHPALAAPVLKATQEVANTLAGPIAKKVEHSGGLTVQVVDPYAQKPEEKPAGPSAPAADPFQVSLEGPVKDCHDPSPVPPDRPAEGQGGSGG